MNTSYGNDVVVLQGISSWFSWMRRDPKPNPVLRWYCTVTAGEEWSSRKIFSKVCKNLSLSLYVSFPNLVWLIYLHTWPPDPTLQRYYDDRYIVVVSPTIALRYFYQFVEVHACNHKPCEKQDQWPIWANSVWPSRSSKVTAQRLPKIRLSAYLLCLLLGKELPPPDAGQGRLQGLLRWTFLPEQPPPRWWNIGKGRLKIVSRICPLCWVYGGRAKDCTWCTETTQRNLFWTSPAVHHSTWAVKTYQKLWVWEEKHAYGTSY